MRNKYGNRKIIDGKMVFDSQKEFLRWNELKLMQRAGVIHDLQWQVKYELVPAIRDENKKVIERGVNYIADFVYIGEDGKTYVEDAKGFRTKEYIIKKKLMLWRYGIRVQEV